MSLSSRPLFGQICGGFWPRIVAPPLNTLTTSIKSIALGHAARPYDPCALAHKHTQTHTNTPRHTFIPIGCVGGVGPAALLVPSWSPPKAVAWRQRGLQPHVAMYAHRHSCCDDTKPTLAAFGCHAGRTGRPLAGEAGRRAYYVLWDLPAKGFAGLWARGRLCRAAPPTRQCKSVGATPLPRCRRLGVWPRTGRAFFMLRETPGACQ